MIDLMGFDREKTCCFTGHRNRDLPFGGERGKLGMKNLVSVINLKIEEAVRDGYDTFISGMSGGIDLICAEAVHNIIARKKYPIKLVCAVPYPEQGMKELHSILDKYIYRMIVNKYETMYISQKFSKDCYKKRNQFMVDHSSRIIGVYKQKPTGSGTLQTINMAKKAGLDLQIIKLETNPFFYLE